MVTIPGPRRQTIAHPVTLEGIGLHLGLALPHHLPSGARGNGSRVPARRLARYAGSRGEGAERGAQRAPHATSRRISRRGPAHRGARARGRRSHRAWTISSSTWTDRSRRCWMAAPGPFFEALVSAGVAHGTRPAEYLELSESVRVIDGASVYEAHPASDLRLEVTIDFPHPLIGRQHGRYIVDRAAFRPGAGGSADIRIHARSGGASRQGPDPGRLDDECGGARGIGADRRDVTLARRIRSPQGDGLRRRSRAGGVPGAGACDRASSESSRDHHPGPGDDAGRTGSGDATQFRRGGGRGREWRWPHGRHGRTTRRTTGATHGGSDKKRRSR